MGVKSKNSNHTVGETHACCIHQHNSSSSMGVLKRVKKRLGLGGRGTRECPTNLPPLEFHEVHGNLINLSGDKRVAHRLRSFCNGITFSSRPVAIHEKVCMRLLHVASNWSGTIRFGFTNHDPASQRTSLPPYSCPDLTSRVGFWVKASSDQHCRQGVLIYYYVTSSGVVHYGVNGEDQGVFFSGVDTRAPLWALIDLYGNATTIELTNHHDMLNNRSPQSLDDVISSFNDIHLTETRTTEMIQASSISRPMPVVNGTPPSSSRHAPNFVPLTFHAVCGRHAILSDHQRVAARRRSEFCCGYVFLSQPCHVNETIVIDILEHDPLFMGSLAVGVTSCDPATLDVTSLPEDSLNLLDRPEYWSLAKDVAGSSKRLIFSITSAGRLIMQHVDQGSTASLFHVDLSTNLWLFFDVYGSTRSIRLQGSLRTARTPPSTPPVQPSLLVVQLPPPSSPVRDARDCSICLENEVNCVLYGCGHMCLCYDCAIQTWRGLGRGVCPICRATIRDVIRTFPS